MSDGGAVSSENMITTAPEEKNNTPVAALNQHWNFYQMYPFYQQNYAQYYQQYYSGLGMSSFNPHYAAAFLRAQQVTPQPEELKQNPPLPPGPPPPLPSNTVAPRPPLLNTPKQFGVRFNLNGKRLLPGNPLQGSSPNSGAAKKKRKRNRNNQVNNFTNSFSIQDTQNATNLPPLPPPEQSPPKPAPPPELMPPSPPKPAPPMSNNNGSNSSIANENANSTQSHLKLNSNPADDWPESLKDYVHRCYARCKDPSDQNKVEMVLRAKITQAYTTNEVHQKDWNKRAPARRIFR